MASEVKQVLTAVTPKRTGGVDPKKLLKTGSTILDLAISGHRGGGFLKGHYFWMVGDSSSGKTWLMLTCLAEASINKEFSNYRFIYDNREDGALMDMERYYGPQMAARLEPPKDPEKHEDPYSENIEDFYFNLDDHLDLAEAAPDPKDPRKGKPFIYLLDSMDALTTRYAEAKFDEAKKEARGGPKAKGDYGDGKAKMNSTKLRTVVNRLSKSGSILIILSQTRDNPDAGMFEEDKTHAGGHALKFYATVQLWSSVGTKLRKTVREREVVVGVTCRVVVRKNRLTGRERTVEFPIYYSTGIDDIGGMVDYLVTWKFWPKNKDGVIDASRDFDKIAFKREALVTWIEENDMRDDLEEIVEAAYNDIEQRSTVERKSKYA